MSASNATGGSWASDPAVRARMQRQPRRDTAPELALRRILHARGLRYFVDRAVVPGDRRRRVDVVFPRARVAVFVDGCFWHGCRAHGRPLPAANASYWSEKIARNAARDRETTDLLEAAGWVVVRVWEHEDPAAAADRVKVALDLASRRRATFSPCLMSAKP